VDELADIWCAWVEMELRSKQFKGALELCRRVTASVPERRERAKTDAHKPVQV
jgi:pre-mRNA-splicing factor SYF1